MNENKILDIDEDTLNKKWWYVFNDNLKFIEVHHIVEW